MSNEVNVLSRTQIIVVEPLSKSVSIISAGPMGPPGPPGADSTVPGPEGPPGPSYTDEQAQDAVGAILVNSVSVNLTYFDSTPSITATINNDGVGNLKLANMANNTIKGRVSSGTGDPEDLTPAQARTVMDVPQNADAVLKSLFTTKGDQVIRKNDGTIVRFPVGADTQVPIADSTVDLGVSWKYKSLPDITWKVVATDRNSTTTLADDPDLTTPTLAAGTKVKFKAFLWWATPTAADFKYAFTGPAGAFLAAVRIGGGPGAAPAGIVIPTGFPITGNHVETSGTQFGALLMEGVCQIAGTAGPIKVQWAQNTSNGTNTTLMQGSYLEWYTLPL